MQRQPHDAEPDALTLGWTEHVDKTKSDTHDPNVRTDFEGEAESGLGAPKNLHCHPVEQGPGRRPMMSRRHLDPASPNGRIDADARVEAHSP